MLTSKKLIFIFIPALLIVAIALFVRIAQFQPLYPKRTLTEDSSVNIQIPIYPDDPIIGDKRAPMTLVVFADFGCPGCALQDEMLRNLMVKYPQAFKIVWKGLAVTKLPYPTDRAHEYAYCANEQKKFDTFAELAFVNQDNLAETILAEIATSIELDQKKLTRCLETPELTRYRETTESVAKQLHVQAVPTFFIDSIQINTPTSPEAWKEILVRNSS